MVNSNVSKKIFGSITMLLILALSLFVLGCMPPPLPENKSLDLSYSYNDTFLNNPPDYATNPIEGFHSYKKGSSVTLTEYGVSGYGVSSWLVTELNDEINKPYEVLGSSHKIIMNNNFEVTARLHCLEDEVCMNNYSCVDNLCVFNEQPQQFVGVVEENDSFFFGGFPIYVERIAESGVLLEINDEVKFVGLSSSDYFFNSNITAQVNNITYDTIINNSCIPNLSDSGVALEVGFDANLFNNMSIGDVYAFSNNTAELISIGQNAVLLSVNGASKSINLNDTVYFAPGIDVTLVYSNQNLSVATLVFSFYENIPVYLDYLEQTYVNNQLVVLDGLTESTALIRINQEEQWINVTTSSYFENADMNVYVDTIFYLDGCGYELINKKAGISLFFD